MGVAERLKATFDELMERHPGANGEFFATSTTTATTRVKLNGEVIEGDALDSGEDIEDMEQPFMDED